MLFVGQLLYSSTTTSSVVRNRTVLPNTTDKINRISNHFRDGWRHEYDVNLRETQLALKLNINSKKNNANNIVLVFDETVQHFWRIAIVKWVLPSRDSEIRWKVVRIAKPNTILKRPLNKLFTVENTHHDTNQTPNR